MVSNNFFEGSVNLIKKLKNIVNKNCYHFFTDKSCFSFVSASKSRQNLLIHLTYYKRLERSMFWP